MPEVSLICATKGRKAELVTLLDSLVAQTYQDFEVIVVDQNVAGFLDEVLIHFSRKLNLIHLRISEFGASLARNRGILHSEGRIVGFPDDDCEYPPDLLTKVMLQFANEATLELFSCSCRSKQTGEFATTQFVEGQVVLDVKNFWARHIAFTLFVSKSVCLKAGLYDERIGLGRRFGSAEETDFVFRLLHRGASGRYDEAIFIHHPPECKDGSPRSLRRAWRYGMGWGGFVQKHLLTRNWPFVLPVYLKSLARSLGGCFFMLLCCKLRCAQYYAYSFAGRCWGLLVPLGNDPLAGKADAEVRVK